MLRPYSPSDLVLARRPPITPLFHSFYILPTQHTSHFATHFSSPLRPTFAPNEKLFARASGNIITSALFFLASFFQLLLLLLLLLPSGRILCGILAKGKILLKFRRGNISPSKDVLIYIQERRLSALRISISFSREMLSRFQKRYLPVFKRSVYQYSKDEFLYTYVCTTSVYQSA